ncbi:hypothetical protein BU14_0023s0024 [Porphyra umbilicalis]|uniref:Uncharacterized protein n=1 Tax=Porphyra umbilicalis TaxID=2786 RepID=A0A1X6PK18_PORUM|nr:hypothetical protein BU14_0023s0024 [Porphyra umbilicalis]|eukprot:OSX81219.1 hypothetical protein BU14_0023s0024 [Porphyra umbilicalis]
MQAMAPRTSSGGRLLAAVAAAAAVAAIAAALTATPATAATCAATPPPTPFDAALVGQTYDLAFGPDDCYRPRGNLRMIVRAAALVVTAEDGGRLSPPCSQDVTALRFFRAWAQPYINVKPGINLDGKYDLLDRFDQSCDRIRAHLGVKERRYDVWGGARAAFIREFCRIRSLATQLRDKRCVDRGDGGNLIPVFTPRLGTPLGTLVAFLDMLAYSYNISA